MPCLQLLTMLGCHRNEEGKVVRNVFFDESVVHWAGQVFTLTLPGGTWEYWCIGGDYIARNL